MAFDLKGVVAADIVNITKHAVRLTAPDMDSVHVPPTVNPAKPPRVHIKFLQFQPLDPGQIKILGFYNNKREKVTDLPKDFIDNLGHSGGLSAEEHPKYRDDIDFSRLYSGEPAVEPALAPLRKETVKAATE